MPIKIDKVLGRVREKDEHRCGIEVSCVVPGVTLEMQLRKQTDIAVCNRQDAEGESMGTDTSKRPKTYDKKRTMYGEWTIWLRYFGNIATLENPKIGVLHKSRHYKMSQIANPLYGVEGETDADVEVFVHKTETRGWLLLCDGDKEARPILFDLPKHEGVWEPLMQVDEFVERFLVDCNGDNKYDRFKYDRNRIGGSTKISQFDEIKGSRRAVFQRAGLTIVSEHTITGTDGLPRTVYTHHSPLYFSMQYEPRNDMPFSIVI